MKDLPLASGRDIAKCLARHFRLEVTRSEKNHWIVSRKGTSPPFQISIPDHPEVKREILAQQLKILGIDHKDFAAKFRSR